MNDQSVPMESESSPVFINFKAAVSINGNIFTDVKSNYSIQNMVSNTIGRLENARIKLNAKIIFKERVLVNSFGVQMNLTKYMRRTRDTILNADKSGMKRFAQSFNLNGGVILPNTIINSSKIYQLNDYTNLTNALTSLVLIDTAELISCDLVFEKKFDASDVSLGESIEQNHIPMKNDDVKRVLHNIDNSPKNCVLETQKDEIQSNSAIDCGIIQSLIIHGDVKFIDKKATEMNVGTINSFEPSSLFNSIVTKTQTSRQTIEISGCKTFMSEMKISFSHVNEFNSQIQIRNWFENSLHQQRTETNVEQIIHSSGWQFNNTIFDNFEIEHSINGVHFAISSNESTNAIFIYDNQLKTVVISSDISFSNSVRINSKLSCNRLRPCKVNHLSPSTLHLSQSMWGKLSIVGDVQLIINEQNEPLSPLGVFSFLEMAVSSNAGSIIATDPTFRTNTGKITLNRVIQASLNDPDIVLVNGINYINVFNDAITQSNRLPNESEFKLTSLHGEKQLIAKETVCGGSGSLVFGKIIVQMINNVDMQGLDRSLFNRNPHSDISILPWQRILFLQDIMAQVVYANANGTINDVAFADVYFIYSGNVAQRTALSFENIIDSNNQVSSITADVAIDVKSINGFNWNFFIDNRFKLKSRQKLPIDNPIIDGFPTFENLILTGDGVKIDQINDAACDDIVLKNSNKKQQISSYKELSMLHIKKPSHTWKMNNAEFVSTYAQTILLNHMQFVEKLVIRSPFQLTAHFETYILKNFNRIPVSEAQYIYTNVTKSEKLN